MHVRALSSLLATVLAIVVCAGCEQQSRPPATLGKMSKPITNGTLDTTPSHAAVVFLDLGGGACTGTLISPNVVLTAAHCVVDDYGQTLSASNVSVGFGTYISSLQWVSVTEVRPHSGYSGSGLDNDIALLRLSQSITSIAPIPFLPSSLAVAQADLNSTLFTFSGYGLLDATNPYDPEQSNSRQMVSDRISCYCNGSSCTNASCSSDAAPNTFCYDQQPGGPCSGDSGGPAFITRGGVEYVAGVTSYGDQTCVSWGCSTKVDRFESFIAGFVGNLQPLGASCSSNAQCLSTFCADGVCCNTACNAGACDACSVAAGASTNGYCAGRSGSCNDGNACTSGDSCLNAICQGTAVTCPAGDACHTAGTCNPSTGACSAPQPKPNGTLCDDGNGCTTGDVCASGLCTGTPQSMCPAPDSCHEASACTAGQCAPFPVKADGTVCNDGSACTSGDTCRAGACLGTPIACPSDPCRPSTCNPSTGQCTLGSALPNETGCDDSNACTSADRCQNGICSGTPVQAACPAPDDCHWEGFCNVATGQCEAQPKPDGSACSDGSLCTRVDSCQAGTCVGSNPVPCAPPQACQEAGQCDWQTGQCVYRRQAEGTSCDDTNPCTHSDFCIAGACGGYPVLCEAQDECHLPGVCAPEQGGCTQPEADDGTPCSEGVCQAGECAAAAAPEADSGCGCASGTGTASWLFFAAPALALLRRRRPRHG